MRTPVCAAYCPVSGMKNAILLGNFTKFPFASEDLAFGIVYLALIIAILKPDNAIPGSSIVISGLGIAIPGLRIAILKSGIALSRLGIALSRPGIVLPDLSIAIFSPSIVILILSSAMF